MPKNKLLELIHKDRVAAAIVCAFMVVSFREKGEEIEPERFTAAELREAVERMERNKDKRFEGAFSPHKIHAVLSYLREQLEAATDNA